MESAAERRRRRGVDVAVRGVARKPGEKTSEMQRRE
jgi:hypothetical protein